MAILRGGLILSGILKVGFGGWIVNNSSRNIKNDNSKANSSESKYQKEEVFEKECRILGIMQKTAVSQI